MIKCIKCKLFYKKIYFVTNHKINSHISEKCNECRLKHSSCSKKYYYNNKEYCKNKNYEYMKIRMEKNPWERTSNYISHRISCKEEKYYRNGIISTLTKEELKILWFRDKAYEMKRPSIDRIDSNEGYCLNNCRYIELSLNSSLGNYQRKNIDNKYKLGV